MKWQGTLGVFGAFFVVAIPLAKWVIADWFKKSYQIETLKDDIHKKSIRNLKHELDDFKIEIKSIKSEIISFYTKLDKIDIRIKNTSENMTKIKDEMIRLDKNLSSIVKSEVKTQIVDLTDQLKMIKGTKNG